MNESSSKMLEIIGLNFDFSTEKVLHVKKKTSINSAWIFGFECLFGSILCFIVHEERIDEGSKGRKKRRKTFILTFIRK